MKERLVNYKCLTFQRMNYMLILYVNNSPLLVTLRD